MFVRWLFWVFRSRRSTVPVVRCAADCRQLQVNLVLTLSPLSLALDVWCTPLLATHRRISDNLSSWGTVERCDLMCTSMWPNVVIGVNDICFGIYSTVILGHWWFNRMQFLVTALKWGIHNILSINCAWCICRMIQVSCWMSDFTG